MSCVVVPVIREFVYAGRLVQPGETIKVFAAEAAVLHRRGVVSLDVGSRRKFHTRESLPEDVTPAVEAPSRRRYRRRDLQAED